MKLMTWPTSPFGAKVKACLKALDLYDTTEIINYFPWLPDDVLRCLNPLNKIPVLILKDGSALYDSPVICDYINEYAKGDLIPIPQKYKVLQIQALCDGILDAAVSARYETHSRPEHLRSKDWYDRQLQGVEAGLKVLDTEPLTNGITLATLSAVVTIAYIELRYSDNPKATIPQSLKAWQTDFVSHHSWLTDVLPKDILPLPKNRITLQS